MPGIRSFRGEEARRRGIETNRRRVPEISRVRERVGTFQQFATLMPFKTSSCERRGRVIFERRVGGGRGAAHNRRRRVCTGV